VVTIEPCGATLVEFSAEQLEQLAETQRRTVVIVDDAHMVDDKLAVALERLVSGRPGAVSLVAATSFQAARSVRSWVRHVRTSGSGVLLGGTAHDGDVLQVKRPTGAGIGILAGRGHLVQRGRVQLVQIAGPDCRTDAPNAPE